MAFDYILVALIVLTILITTVALLILLERKFLAIAQRRIGPSILGRRGFLQIIADVIKPLFKNIFEQKFQSITLISFFIFILFFSQTLYLSFFSYGINGVLYDNVDFVILLQLGITGVSTLSILIIGYLSGTKYGIIGSVRMVVSEISVEALVGLLNSIVYMNTAGFDFNSLNANQGNALNLLLLLTIYSVVYIIHMFITAQRAPLDLIENEGELVSGYNTEFSGPDVLVIYFAEYLHIVNAAIQFIYVLFGYSILITPNFYLIDNMLDIIVEDYLYDILHIVASTLIYEV